MSTDLSLARRRFLQLAGTSVAALSLPRSLAARDTASPLIVREASPYNAEAPLPMLPGDWTTPTPLMFVRNHGKKVPDIDVKKFKLKIEGMVDKPLELSLDELQKLGKRISTHATITCAGNRRDEHSAVKKISGVQWSAGAIGNALWEGISLREVLSAAGAHADAKHVWFEGLDEVEHGDHPTPFGGSIPLQRLAAKQLPVLLATHMNEAPLTPEHGFPLRVVVPGFIGARSVKWLGKIVVSDKPSPNYFIAGTYKVVKTSDAEEMEKAEPIYENVLNSAICTPATGTALRSGKHTIAGYALPTGNPNARISKVEVRIDDGKWREAKLINEGQPYCWALWNLEADLPPGKRTLAVRATDSLGTTQPEKAEWNAKGYLYNGWHRVEVLVDG